MDDSTLKSNVAEVALKELREDENSRLQALEQFREWIAQNQDIVFCRTDNNFLLRFLRFKKFSLPMAEQSMVNFITMRQNYSHFMHDLDIQSQEINDLISSGYSFASPCRDDKGRKVIFTAFGKINPEKNTHVPILKAIQLTNAALMEDETSQVMGFTWIFDFSNISMAVLSLMPIAEVVAFVKSGEKSTPMRHKEFHVLNLPSSLVFAFNILKNCCSAKLQERFMIHSSVDELTEKVNSKCLPKEYGGSMPMTDMADLWKEELMSRRQTILDLDKLQLRVYSKDQELSTENLEAITGVQGSFRRIEID